MAIFGGLGLSFNFSRMLLSRRPRTDPDPWPAPAGQLKLPASPTPGLV